MQRRYTTLKIQKQKALMVYRRVIAFWFEEIDPSCWWKKDAAFDALLVERFSDIHRRAIHCELFGWRDSAEGRLAEIIVLDQFSRNICRGSPRAFAYDPMSLALSQEAISVGADQQLNAAQRSFLYMPFMHSESLAIHKLAVEMFRKNEIQSNLEFEIKHRDIIARFGRYPHRNKILGRESTAEEIEYLSRPGSGF